VDESPPQQPRSSSCRWFGHPVSWLLYHAAGAIGLSLASDIAILLQTAALALLLHRRRMVRLSGLERAELGRAVLATVASLMALYGLRYLLPSSSRIADVIVLAAGTAVHYKAPSEQD
jgi:putative peptidoglycan lipid II flippase